MRSGRRTAAMRASRTGKKRFHMIRVYWLEIAAGRSQARFANFSGQENDHVRTSVADRQAPASLHLGIRSSRRDGRCRGRNGVGRRVDPSVRVPRTDEALADLRSRIAATKWPGPEAVKAAPAAVRDPGERVGATQGVQLATMQKLASYWADGLRLAEGRSEARRPAAVRHDDRRARHPLHPRQVEAPERVADHRHARLARLDHRAVEDHRSARPNPTAHGGSGGGRLRRRDPLDAGLRLLRQADDDRLGSGAHRARLGRADEAARLRALRGAGRRLGQR